MIWKPRMDEEYSLMDKGRQKWENKVLTQQRKMLFNYYQMSTVYQRLAFVQSIALCWIYTNQLNIFLKYIAMMVYSLVMYFYLLGKMKALIDQWNNRIRSHLSAINSYHVQ